MKNEIAFKLKIKPPTATAQQKGEAIVNGHIHHYKKKNVRQAESVLMYALLPYVPKEPMVNVPIKLTCIWNFYSKSHKPGTWKITRPDGDNLNKMLKDVMTDMGFWKDDSQIVAETVVKRWVKPEEEGIEIYIAEME